MGFFNDLGKKATEAYKTTSDKTNKMAREMKLKSYINENKNRINDVYTEIGKKVYEKFNEGNLSDVEGLIKPELDKIAEYARKIENFNNEIRAINNIKLCKTCAAEIDINARFCSKCGAEQKEEVVETENPENKIEEVVNAEPVYPVEPEVMEEPITENIISVPEEPAIVETEPQVIEPAIEETVEEPIIIEPVIEEKIEENNDENQDNQDGSNE